MFMAQKTGKKFGAGLDTEAVDRFGAWCDVEKLARGGAADTALRMIEEVPLNLRSLALRGEWAKVREWFDRAEQLMMRAAVEEGMHRESQQEPPVAERRKAGGKE